MLPSGVIDKFQKLLVVVSNVATVRVYIYNIYYS